MPETLTDQNDAPAPEPGESGESPFVKPGAEDVPHLVLSLDDDEERFEAYPEANAFLLVKHLADITVPGYRSILGVTRLAQGQVRPHELGRLNEYLELHGHADNYSSHIYDQLAACWSGDTMLPPASRSGSSSST